MPSYTLTIAAENDLAEIARYTVETFGIEQAIIYRDGLIETFKFLAENPQAARVRAEIKPPVRVHRFQSHIVIYQVSDEAGIKILRVRHGREDWISDPLD